MPTVVLFAQELNQEKKNQLEAKLLGAKPIIVSSALLIPTNPQQVEMIMHYRRATLFYLRRCCPPEEFRIGMQLYTTDPADLKDAIDALDRDLGHDFELYKYAHGSDRTLLMQLMEASRGQYLDLMQYRIQGL